MCAYIVDKVGEVNDCLSQAPVASPALNPKLVTQRGSVAGPVSPPLKRPKTPPSAPRMRPLSAPPRCTPCEHLLGRRTFSGCSDTSSVPSRKCLTQRYKHVRSVVKDIVERRITPLEARHGKCVRRQKLQDTGRAARRLSPEHLRGRDSDPKADGGSSLLRVNSPRDTHSGGRCDTLKKDAPLRPLPISATDRTCVMSARQPGQRFGERIAYSPSVRKLSERAYLAVLASNCDSTKVPHDFVPQCAKNIPERYKHRPTVVENQDVVSEQKNGLPCVNTPRMRTKGISGQAKCRSARDPFTAHTSSTIMKANDITNGADLDKATAAMPKSSFSARGPQTSVHFLPKAKAKVTVDPQSAPKALGAKNISGPACAKSGRKKPLEGLERVLLFNIEPPKLQA